MWRNRMMHIQGFFSFFKSQHKARRTSTAQLPLPRDQQRGQQKGERYSHYSNITVKNSMNGAEQSQHFDKIEEGSSGPVSLIPRQALPPNANCSSYYGALWRDEKEKTYSSSYSTVASTHSSSITQSSPFPARDSFFPGAATPSSFYSGSASLCPSLDDAMNIFSIHSDIMTNTSPPLSVEGQEEHFDYGQTGQHSPVEAFTDHISIKLKQPPDNYDNDATYNEEVLLSDDTQRNQLFFTFHNANKEVINNINSASNEYGQAPPASFSILEENDAIIASQIPQCENDLSYLAYPFDEQEAKNISINNGDNSAECNTQEFSLYSWGEKDREPPASVLPAADESHKRRRLSPHIQSWPSSSVPSSGTTNSSISVEPEKCCRICGNSFSRSSDRKRHEESVHGEFLLYPCDLCGKHFGRSDIRKKHRGNKACIRKTLLIQ